MARQSKEGKFIIAAGEIGAFTVCPEAWRLKSLEKAKSLHAPSVVEGQKAHDAWAHAIDETEYLTHRIRFVLTLLVAALLSYLVFHSKGSL